MSLIEAITNIAVGFGLAIATQMLVFPLFGLHASLVDNLLLGLLFTAISIGRSYALRRVFEAILIRPATETPPPGDDSPPGGVASRPRPRPRPRPPPRYP